MRKLLLVTAITIFGFVHVNAQDIEFGAKLGINFATVSGDNSGELDSIISLINFGVFVEIPINEKFSFQPEILYSIQGYSFDDDVVALNYLNIPLIGKYYVTKGLSLEAGPQIGFLLSAKDDGKDVKNNFNNIDFGVNLGLGYKLENGLNFGVRYNLGLSNINNIEGSSNKLRNGVVQATVGYSFF
jgi:hypothetical protein